MVQIFQLLIEFVVLIEFNYSLTCAKRVDRIDICRRMCICSAHNIDVISRRHTHTHTINASPYLTHTRKRCTCLSARLIH